MTVSYSGDRMTFWVGSADDPLDYSVDLLANGGRGACTCADFRFRCQPLLDGGKKIIQYGYPDRTVCKHIGQVHYFMSISAVANILKVDVKEIYEQKDKK